MDSFEQFPLLNVHSAAMLLARKYIHFLTHRLDISLLRFCSFLLSTIISTALFAQTTGTLFAQTPGTFVNPLNSGADPWVGYVDGAYYLATTQRNRVDLWKAASLRDLADATPITIWGTGIDVWAPEFHQLDGPNGKKWYAYFTMSDGPDISHRLYVVESEGGIEGPYGEPIRIKTDPLDEYYAIDGSVFVHSNGKTYFMWAGHPGHRIFISEMENPWTLKGDRILIPAAGFGCSEVREGPFIITHRDRLFLTYSACDTGKPDYKLGALWTTRDQDPMDPKSWTQVEEPILARDDQNGVYGPGHHSFFKSPDGSQDWIAYHGKTSSEYTYRGRSTRAQKVEWTEDGMIQPIVPLALGAPIALPSGDPQHE